ncbi:amidase signature enzyme [Periconia macrospinosa]|uniref:Amidase signature enzyme n=1 Tax=Periconia macrospinosa TaxID=97972 RepID=A0A2V1DQS4_9PLEO|nr:amidase signature enzyme [Periconia macrospinosa]
MPTHPFLLTLTLSQASALLKTHQLTSYSLVHTYLTRIDEVNDTYNAVLQTNPSALEEASFRDLERLHLDPSSVENLSILHGIPIMLKDNIVTLDDSMEATCGSLALVGAKPAEESAVVGALRRAGAVILGKANMAEWSGFRSTSGCSGWSGRGGQATGIYYKGMKASGSSTGCAIAVALGLCFAAIGTETSWSIVSPAERSAVVGFKPTRNVIPSDGIIHASRIQDTLGVLARTVEDAGLLVSILACDDEVHPKVLKKPLSTIGDRNSASLGNIRVGVPGRLLEIADISGVRMEAFRQVLDMLQTQGAKIDSSITIEGTEEYDALSGEEKQIVLDTDMKTAVNIYLSKLQTNPNKIHTLDDIIAFTKACPEEEFPDRNVAVLERSNATNPENELYKKMLERDKYFGGEGGIPGALKRYNVDVILMPCLSPMMSIFAAKAGSPVLSLPMGVFSSDTEIKLDVRGMIDIAPGIPFSLYIYGGVEQDAKVLQVAHTVERMISSHVRDALHMYLAPQTDLCVRDSILESETIPEADSDSAISSSDT